jgi:hypothetical protein
MMKIQLLALVFCFVAQGAFGAAVKARCTNSTNTGFVEEKTMTVVLTRSQVKADLKSAHYVGQFIKVLRNGTLQYSCAELADLADQTDYSYFLVSPRLVKGQSGNITISVRQLGDSEGSWWLNETFSCKVSR